jgi:hypothetical protein
MGTTRSDLPLNTSRLHEALQQRFGLGLLDGWRREVGRAHVNSPYLINEHSLIARYSCIVPV